MKVLNFHIIAIRTLFVQLKLATINKPISITTFHVHDVVFEGVSIHSKIFFSISRDILY